MSDDDLLYRISTIMNVDQAEIAKIVHSYIERGISCEYDRLNCSKPPIYIGPVKVKSLKERLEETKMNATSIQNIKNVRNISFSIENHPMEMKSKLTIVASTDDDIFKFEFEGPDLLEICKGAGLFTGWEKDQKIRKLDKENKSLLEVIDKTEEENKNLRIQVRVLEDIKKENYELKAKSKDISDDNASLLETNKKLKKENEERMFVNISTKEKNRMLEIENEKLKERIETLKTLLNNLYGNTAQQFKEAKPNTRESILDQAKKCVCGQREQDYGTPESNFQLIADLWNGYLGTKYRYVDDDKPINIAPLRALDVSMMMALLKIARIKNGGGSGDSFVDLAGYAACGGEIWASNKATNGDSSQETN